MLRHVVALLTCLSMLHLTLVGSELAPCASHHAAGMSMGAAAHSAPSREGGAGALTHGSAMHHVAEPGAGVPSHCPAPAPSDCCSAASACGAVAIMSAGVRASRGAGTRQTAHAEPGTLQFAIAPAPEPPPPRA